MRHTNGSVPEDSTVAVPGSVFLVGMMGAGKTSVGRMLARRLRKNFVDSDHEIERRTGVRVPVIFEIEGEAGFRRREVAMIDELTQLDDIVLATGGGAVLDPVNRAALASRGTTVYLCADPSELFARTRHDKSRPLLQTDNPLGRIHDLTVERDPLYREVSHLVVETGVQSVRTLVSRIEQALVKRLRPCRDACPMTDRRVDTAGSDSSP